MVEDQREQSSSVVFKSKEEAKKKAIEFLKQQVKGKLDSKTLQF